ncbi:MAG TPA: hypothetical protein DCS97_12805 [Planctomycetes bacterium]|nr:hypothetical protein [Planctomycetota bacterium]
MAGDQPPAKPLICPACFAREIDPVFLHHDPEDGGEWYCIHCSYTARSADEVRAFLDGWVRMRHGVDRRQPV